MTWPEKERQKVIFFDMGLVKQVIKMNCKSFTIHTKICIEKISLTVSCGSFLFQGSSLEMVVKTIYFLFIPVESS
jgi:hypothetical protein